MKNARRWSSLACSSAHSEPLPRPCPSRSIYETDAVAAYRSGCGAEEAVCVTSRQTTSHSAAPVCRSNRSPQSVPSTILRRYFRFVRRGQKRTHIPAPTSSKVSNNESRAQPKAPFKPHSVNGSPGWRPVAMLTPCVVEACNLLSQQALKTLSHAQPSFVVYSLTRESSKFIPTSVVVIDHHITRAKHLRPTPR